MVLRVIFCIKKYILMYQQKSLNTYIKWLIPNLKKCYRIWIIGEKYAGEKYMPLMTENQKTSVEDIKKYFSWFDKEFSNLIKTVCAEYWQLYPDVRLFSLEKNSKNFSSGNKYFGAGTQIGNVKYVLKLSDTLCNTLLTKRLGENDSPYFDLREITELEGEVLNKFGSLLLSEFKKHILSPKEVKKLIEKEVNLEDCVNLGFIVYDENDDPEKFEMGKLVFSIPQKLFKLPELPEIEQVIDTTKFKKAKTPVDIFVGKTKLSLDDIRNIEPEDIVVLERSNIKKMAIISPTEFDFNVNPDPRLFIKEDEDDTEELQKENIAVSTKDIWDNVQVDVCAKFPQVKMSLGELREMAEGVVVELDSVYGNEVVLEVENKNVAKGELVIIGYKYGIKITEICSQNEVEEVSEQSGGQINSDDFDVNDFEIEE